ncbi:unnamed protein product [Ilex paraguariensis]|uniref:Uncharacterized protein n=1 Tax=Ilex paraguariensis TaxID=185542 RepID=A0ABC8QT90_9AQUA
MVIFLEKDSEIVCKIPYSSQDFHMARFILFCLVVAELSIFMGKTNGSRGLDPEPQMAALGADQKMFTLVEVPVPSPAPSEGGVSTGINETSYTRLVTRHHSSDKSMAGGDVILGGFATAVVASIVCYIRVTRRNQHVNAETLDI